ncbi:Molybdopterin synthase sulfurylase [Pseudoloma neurophilia]|uniref:Molybdopterin synthase sulfurylase n=1 Tax=Pseudoloma neurophilia TaxID=146866 RepID=A0A0R0M752_9MICR|nr:Molybdopterin synthase sulfurylase [Pseudoloma neurophilia]
MKAPYDNSLVNYGLPPKDIQKYKRQLVLSDCTVENQKKIFDAKILVIGMGGLGIPVVLYLVGSGFKNISIVDGDKIELSNLHRQIAFNIEDIGQYKSDIIGQKLQKMNNDLNLTVYSDFLTERNVNLVKDHDIIIDCSDNIQTRYLLNDHSRDKIFICASVLRWNGQIYLFYPDDACYRCLYPVMKKKPDSCNNAGIMGPICGVIGSLVAVEVVKLIFNPSKSKMYIYDAKQTKLTEMTVRQSNTNCTACCQRFSEKESLDAPKLKQNCSDNGCRTHLESKHFITWDFYLKNSYDFDLIDIRPEKLFKLANIKGSINIPRGKFSVELLGEKTPVILCPRGISAQEIAKQVHDHDRTCFVIKDGLQGFKRDVYPDWPF